MAGWAMLLLAERRLIDLDAPIITYLTTFQLPANSSSEWEAVTIRRLLAHHGGVTPNGFRGVPKGVSGGSLRDALKRRLPPMTEEQIAYYRHWKLEEDGPVELVKTPGESWLYSNVGFGLLECMLEDVTGENYNEFVTREILRPLGVQEASFEVNDDLCFAKPYTFDGAATQLYSYPCKAAAGVYSHIVDLARFASAEIRAFNGISNSSRVISTALAQLLIEPFGLADKVLDRQFKTGLGHLTLEANGRRFVTHSGGTLGWRSTYCIQPETGKGFCALMNSDQTNDYWIPMQRAWVEQVF